MFTLISQAFPQVLTLQNLIVINVGMLVGIIFGAIPGLNGNLAITVLLPFTFSMDTIPAILMLTAIFFGSNFGGSISAILINTPGTGNAAATVLDGYPLAQKGYPNKSLMTALTASTFGGIFSALCLLFLSQPISDVARKMSYPEYFALAVFGLSIIAFISGKSMAKGLICGGIGVLLSTVGIDKTSGLSRFTFGKLQLYSGLTMMAVLLGTFAISQMIDRVVKQQQNEGSSMKESLKDDKLTLTETKGLIPTMLKSSLIGAVIGAIPGTGGNIAAFISYNEARRKAKPDEHFGEGALRGIAAPESANNGATCCVLIPLLTLGIPGDIVAATLLSALTMHGLIVGPQLFATSGVTVYAILIGCVIAQVFIYLQGKYLLGLFVKATNAPYDLLTAALVAICCTGAYSINGKIMDVYVMCAAGIISYVLKKFDFPIVPLVLGMVLGSTAESNLRSTVTVINGSWLNFFKRPVCLGLTIILILLIVTTIRGNRSAAAKTSPSTIESDKSNEKI